MQKHLFLIPIEIAIPYKNIDTVFKKKKLDLLAVFSVR